MEGLLNKLGNIGTGFRLDGQLDSFEEISQGNVNSTYKVNYKSENGSVKAYLFQRINAFVFKKPDELMENVDSVTEYLREKHPEVGTLHFCHTAEGKPYIFDDDGGFWRVYGFVEAVTFDSVDNLEVVRNAAGAFGDFQMALAGFDASKLYYTIPDFHNTIKRYEKLEADVALDPCGRVQEVREEIDWLMSVKDEACKLSTLEKEGKLPLRVTHNDTKINNVLFDAESNKALMVIDLDTVMPGLVGHDFGDAVRFAANFTEEDSEDTDRTGLDLNVFWAFADGFLKKTAKVLTPLEIETLALSVFALTCELSTRFLDDYICGDQYFRCKKPGHNIIRTRCQIALAKDVQKKLDAMKAIIIACAEKYSAD